MPQIDTPQLIAMAAALGWASGLRLYAVLFLVGAAGYMGWVELPPGLQLLQHPVMLVASGFMLFVEFFADKIPGVDSVWDLVHTLLRIPAGAALAAGVFGADHATWAVAALLGGSLAATSHAPSDHARSREHLARAVLQHRRVAARRSAVPVMLWLAWAHPGVLPASRWPWHAGCCGSWGVPALWFRASALPRRPMSARFSRLE